MSAFEAKAAVPSWRAEQSNPVIGPLGNFPRLKAGVAMAGIYFFLGGHEAIGSSAA